MDLVAIGKRIHEARTEKEMSLQDIATDIGVAKSTVQRYEAGGIENIKLPVVEAIARSVGVNPSWVLGKSRDKYVKEKPATSDGDGLELTEEEHEHIRLLRAASPELQAAALAMLEAADKARLVQDSSEEDK